MSYMKPLMKARRNGVMSEHEIYAVYRLTFPEQSELITDYDRACAHAIRLSSLDENDEIAFAVASLDKHQDVLAVLRQIASLISDEQT